MATAPVGLFGEQVADVPRHLIQRKKLFSLGHFMCTKLLNWPFTSTSPVWPNITLVSTWAGYGWSWTAGGL